MKILISFGLFFIMPYLFRIFLRKGMSRKWYALCTAILLALTFFILSMMHVKEDALLIGSIMFLLILIGSYPTQYFLYPIQSKLIHHRNP